MDMRLRSEYLAGVLLALAGALLFSTKAVMVKLAYRYEVEAISLLLLRMLFALPVYLLIVATLWKKKISVWKEVSAQHWLGLVAAAGLGFYLSSYFDFAGLQYIDAMVERLILFIYPTIIAVLSVFVFKEKLTHRQVLALTISYGGLFFVFGQNLQSISLDNDFWKGASLIFLCAITFATFYIFSQWLIPHFGSTSFTSISMAVACLFVILHFLWSSELQDLKSLDSMVYIYGLLMALVATVIPSYLVNHAIKILGATRVGILGSIGPVSTITLAYIFLGESLTFWQGMGALFIIVGVTLVSFESRRRRVRAKAS